MKGRWGTECARKECSFKPAFFRHKLNSKFYCMACAKQINEAAHSELCKLERSKPK